MAKQYLEFNHKVIPDLANGFVRSRYFFGNGTAFFRGGRKAVKDPAFPCHTLIFNWDRGQLFCTEETLKGLKENSIEKYRDPDNRIISVLYWTGWDDSVRRNEALDYLAYLRRKQGDESTDLGKYDWPGLGSFMPGIRLLPWFKPDPVKDWCAENDLSVMKKFGCPWITKTTLAPDQAYLLMKDQKDVRRILNYYKYPEGV